MPRTLLTQRIRSRCVRRKHQHELPLRMPFSCTTALWHLMPCCRIPILSSSFYLVARMRRVLRMRDRLGKAPSLHPKQAPVLPTLPIPYPTCWTEHSRSPTTYSLTANCKASNRSFWGRISGLTCSLLISPSAQIPRPPVAQRTRQQQQKSARKITKNGSRPSYG